MTREQKLHDALRKASYQFTYYAEQHRAKNTPEADQKALVNDLFAIMCEDALGSKDDTQ